MLEPCFPGIFVFVVLVVFVVDVCCELWFLFFSFCGCLLLMSMLRVDVSPVGVVIDVDCLLLLLIVCCCCWLFVAVVDYLLLLLIVCCCCCCCCCCYWLNFSRYWPDHFGGFPLSAPYFHRLCERLFDLAKVGSVGITTGEAFCGVVGSKTRKEYTVLVSQGFLFSGEGGADACEGDPFFFIF